MRRRHRKAHRILSVVLLLASVAILALAWRAWLGAPLTEAVDPGLTPPPSARVP